MDDFEDILEPRRHHFDLGFALQTREGIPEYKYSKRLTAAQVKESVLASARLKFTIDKIVTEKDVPRKQVVKEAEEILEDMAHSQSSTNLRTLAFLFSKIYKKLLRHLYVNKDGAEKLRSYTKEAPILLLPTHRSYMDFLVMTYVCYHYGLPMPFVATGQDFNNMKLINEVLRMSGAFYIRRSFGGDDLYWALFTEYVQTNIINGELPLEFFLEGTRSRTGKFLPPKLGLLAVALEPYFTGKVPDILLVPVSFTYDRILEELLHSREMLGIPKPKESTSGLIKARTIFQDNYGDTYVHIGDPISVRELASPRVDRSVHNTLPRFLFNLSPGEQKFVADIAYLVQESQLKNIYMSVWVLCATLLMQRPQGYMLRDFCRDVEWLKDLTINLGAKVAWPGEYSVQTLVTSHLRRHKTFVNLAHKNQVSVNPYEGSPVNGSPIDVSTLDEVMSLSVVPMGVAMYRNHLVCRLANICLLASSFCGQNVINVGDLFLNFWFLVRLFKKEFVFKPSVVETEFAATLKKLESCTFIKVSHDDKRVEVLSTGTKPISFLNKMIQPFIYGYFMACEYLLETPCSSDSDNSSKYLVKNIQAYIADKIIRGEHTHYDTLSLNLLANALMSLATMGTIHGAKSNGGVRYSWKQPDIKLALEKIGAYLPDLKTKTESGGKDNSRRASLSITSKL